MYTRRGLPLELWYGRSRPLNPYLRGVLIDYLRKEMFPKELKVLPSEVIEGSTEDVLSRTLLRSWVRQWLTYCRWYYVTALSPTVTIQDFFDAPVVNRDWRVTSVDPELVRFGLLWKLYDLIAEKGLDLRAPILESKPGNWLLGDTSGTSFLALIYAPRERIIKKRGPIPCTSNTVYYRSISSKLALA